MKFYEFWIKASYCYNTLKRHEEKKILSYSRIKIKICIVFLKLNE